ncbi:MAG TPA: hypothetical protein VFW03_08100 [Gemmatimonadaceae bacterium]|nr:hypothetical protein [Gemmatimonadaceae bacterium]
MRTAGGAALVAAALLALAAPRPAESQIGGFIKKKASDVAKGEANKKGDASTSKADSCGAITPEKIQDFLRGLQAEGAARNEFDSRVASEEAARAEAEPRVKACRDAENGGANFQKIMTEGFTGANAPSTGPAVQAQLEKNKAKYEEYLDKKCGKVPPPVSHDPGDTYRKAHANGAKEAGMSEYCYDVLADRVIAFCRLSNKDQAKAVEKGIRVANVGDVFTADEAKAIQPHCGELMPALKKAGNTMVP